MHGCLQSQRCPDYARVVATAYGKLFLNVFLSMQLSWFKLLFFSLENSISDQSLELAFRGLLVNDK